MPKADTINIAVVIDDKGSVTLRKIGDESEKAGKKGEKGMARMRKGIADLDDSLALTLPTFTELAGYTFATTIAGLGALAAAGVAVVTSAAAQAKEIENLARLANMGSEQFQNYAYATDTVGVNQEKLADISKDVQDKLGDFIATGGGEFADFFENVAPKVGLTAEALQGLSGPDVLIAVKKAMDDVNLSAEEQTFYLESLGNDAALLTPLLKDNGAALKEQAAQAEALGIALSEVESQQLIEAGKAIKQLTSLFDALKNKIGAELSPVVTDLVKLIVAGMTEGSGGVDALANDIAVKLLQAIGMVIEVMRFFHNGWLLIKIAGTLAIDAIAKSLEFLFGGMRKFLFMLDAAFNLAVKLGALEVNPLDDIEAVLSTFSASSRDVTKDVLDDIEKTNAAYDKAKRVVEGYVDTVKASGAAGSALIYSNQTADIAGLAAAEQKLLQDGVVNHHIEGNGKIVKDTKKAYGEMFDLSIAYHQGLEDANDRGLADYDRMLEEQVALEEDLTARLKELTLSELDYKKWALDEEVAAMREAAGGQQDLLDMIAEYQRRKQEEMLKGTKALTDASEQLWRDFASDTGNIIGDFLSDLAHGKFDNFKEAFQGMLDSMLDMLISFVSKATAMSIIETIFNVDSGQTTLGDLISGIGDWFSDSGSTTSIGMGGATVSDGALHVKVVGGDFGGGSTSSVEKYGSALADAFEAGTAWDTIGTNLGDSLSDSLDNLDFSITGNGFADLASSDFFNTGDSAWDATSSAYDNIFTTGGKDAWDMAADDFWSASSDNAATWKDTIQDFKDSVMPYATAAAGAYSIYTGIKQGDVNGAFQAVGGASSVYNAGVDAGLYEASSLVGTASTAVAGAGGIYSMYQGFQSGNPVQIAGGAIQTYNAATTLYPAVSEAVTTGITNAAATITGATTTAATSAATTAATQTIIAAEGVGWSTAAATTTGTASTATGAAGAGMGAWAGPVGMAIWMASSIYANETKDKHRYESSYGGFDVVERGLDSQQALLYNVNGISEAIAASVAPGANVGPDEMSLIANQRLDVLANQFGEKMAGMALAIEPTLPSFDAYITATTGVKLSTEEVTWMMEKATEASFGNKEAINALEYRFQQLGQSSIEASVSTLGMISAMSETTAAMDVGAQGYYTHLAEIANGTSKLGQTTAELKAHFGVAQNAFVDLSHTVQGQMGALDEYGNVIENIGAESGESLTKLEQFGGAIRGISAEALAAMGMLSSQPDTPVFTDKFADGGILAGGSGVRDDLYLGTINGRHQIAMGGEYIMPPEQTAKYYQFLELMRYDRFAQGGVTGGNTIQVPVATSTDSGSGDGDEIIVHAKIFVGDQEIKQVIRKEIEIQRRKQGRRDSSVDEVRLQV